MGGSVGGVEEEEGGIWGSVKLLSGPKVLMRAAVNRIYEQRVSTLHRALSTGHSVQDLLCMYRVRSTESTDRGCIQYETNFITNMDHPLWDSTSVSFDCSH